MDATEELAVQGERAAVTGTGTCKELAAAGTEEWKNCGKKRKNTK
jgi:hypothetical protein